MAVTKEEVGHEVDGAWSGFYLPTRARTVLVGNVTQLKLGF